MIHLFHRVYKSGLLTFFALIFAMGIFYPSGAEPTNPPISQQNIHCSLGRLGRLSVVQISFGDRDLTFAAIEAHGEFRIE
jgi:hypothetical protein